jgi:hypothetical protein
MVSIQERRAKSTRIEIQKTQVVVENTSHIDKDQDGLKAGHQF